MNFWMDIALDELKAVIAKIDVLTINDEEARQLSGVFFGKSSSSNSRNGTEILGHKKVSTGVVFNKESVFFAPALPLEDVFDPTGAGDSFAGGFIGYLASTRDISFDNMKRAIIFGSAMASFCVEKFGTEKLIGLSQEIDERYKTSLTLYSSIFHL